MEKLEINHDSEGVIEAFLNKEKAKRIIDFLSGLGEDSVKATKRIETTIYSFADTYTEAVGIAILMTQQRVFEAEKEKIFNSSSNAFEALREIMDKSRKEQVDPIKAFLEQSGLTMEYFSDQTILDHVKECPRTDCPMTIEGRKRGIL